MADNSTGNADANPGANPNNEAGAASAPEPKAANASDAEDRAAFDLGAWPAGNTEAEIRDISIMTVFYYTFFILLFLIAFCILMNCLISLWKRKSQEMNARCRQNRRIDCLPEDFGCVKFNPTVRSPCCEPRTEFCLAIPPDPPFYVPPPCNPCSICK